MSFKKDFERIAWVIERILFYICSGAMLAVSLVVCIEIISRNVFGHSFIWVEEFSLIMLGWIAFLSAAYTLRKKGHVALEFLYKKFPMNMRKLLYILFTIGMCLFFFYIFLSGVKNCRMQMSIPLTQTRLPRGLIFMGLPVGCCLMIYFFIVEFAETIFWGDKTALMASDELVQYTPVEGDENEH